MTTNDEFSIRPATEIDSEPISRLVSQLSQKFIISDYSPRGAATLLSNQTPGFHTQWNTGFLETLLVVDGARKTEAAIQL